MLSLTKWISVLALVGLGSSAFAADGEFMDSEYLHQPGTGAFELTPGIGGAPGNTALLNQQNGLTLSSYNIRGTDAKLNLFVVPVTVAADYGINSMFAVGVQLAYGLGSTNFSNCPQGSPCRSQTINGLFDPQLYLKGRAAVGSGVIQYGVVATVGVEKSKTNSTGDSNWASGGSTITPFVAYQFSAGPGVLGARVKYDVYKGDRKSTIETSNASVDATTTDGNTLGADAFYEMPVGNVTLGGAIIYSSRPDTKSAFGNSASKADKNANSIIGAQIYAPVHLSGMTLLPTLEYQTLNYSASDSSVIAINTLQLGIAARLTF